MTSRCGRSVGALVAASLAGVTLAAAAPLQAEAPRLTSLEGAPSALASRGQVMLLWRADCAPCLLELSDLAALRTAARPLALTPVGLQPTALLQPALRRLKLSTSESLRTDEDAAALLTRLGGAPPRLPLAVAFRADGSLCGVHSGLIGRDQVRAWAQACGSARALR